MKHKLASIYNSVFLSYGIFIYMTQILIYLFCLHFLLLDKYLKLQKYRQ